VTDLAAPMPCQRPSAGRWGQAPTVPVPGPQAPASPDPAEEPEPAPAPTRAGALTVAWALGASGVTAAGITRARARRSLLAVVALLALLARTGVSRGGCVAAGASVARSPAGASVTRSACVTSVAGLARSPARVVSGGAGVSSAANASAVTAGHAVDADPVAAARDAVIRVGGHAGAVVAGDAHACVGLSRGGRSGFAVARTAVVGPRDAGVGVAAGACGSVAVVLAVAIADAAALAVARAVALARTPGTGVAVASRARSARVSRRAAGA
jgi:hypothetical protein